MCDIVPGQLIIYLPLNGSAASAPSLSSRLPDALKGMRGIRYIESIEQKLAKHGLTVRKQIGCSLHLIEVKPGEENRATGLLYDWYNTMVQPPGPFPAVGAPKASIVVAPNYVMRITGSGTGSSLISGLGFTFGPQYGNYQSMTGLPASKPSNSLRVLVVDTGVARDAKISVHSKKNLLDVNDTLVEDENGHGTAVALVIDDLAPGNEFVIYKAGDANGHVNEWDLLAALLADSGTDVINLSVEYGLATRVCTTCGRQSSSSRSAVFENILNGTATWAQPPVIVAAVGNDNAAELAYPARFGSIVAAGSVNSSKRRSQESNSGDLDHDGRPHDNHFVAPGGDSDATTPEHVIELSSGTTYRGTSFATAFVTAVVMAEMASQGSFTSSSVLSKLRANADKKFTWHNDPEYGHGVVHV